MPSMTEHAKLIDKIRQLPTQAEAAVRNLSEKQLDTPYGPGKWTVRQVVHHLADSHMNAFIRMKLALLENHPTIKPYEQTDWATTQEALHAPVELSLSILRGLHGRWATLLESLPEDSWSRAAFHPERKCDLTLADFLRLYSHHGENHVGQITGLRKAQGW